MTQVLNTTIESKKVLTLEEIELLEKFQAKKERDLKESERVEKVFNLLDTVFELRFNSSQSVINDLLAIAKAKDFTEHFISEISGFKNYCFYDGKILTTIKESGEVSVKKLDFKIFVKVYFCDFSNYLPKAIIKSEESFSDTEIYTSSQSFDRMKETIIAKYTEKAVRNSETNLAEIFKMNLKIKGLKLKNKANDKAEKLASKKAKK